MNKAITTFVLALAFIGGFLIFYNPKPASSPTENNSETLDTIQKWESKIDEQASVTVTVTPSDLSLESKEWKFDVVLNTHSVELDQDIHGLIHISELNENRKKKEITEGETYEFYIISIEPKEHRLGLAFEKKVSEKKAKDETPQPEDNQAEPAEKTGAETAAAKEPAKEIETEKTAE